MAWTNRRRRAVAALLLAAFAVADLFTSALAAMGSYAPPGYAFHQDALLVVGLGALVALGLCLVPDAPWASLAAALVALACLGLALMGLPDGDFVPAEAGLVLVAGAAASVAWPGRVRPWKR